MPNNVPDSPSVSQPEVERLLKEFLDGSRLPTLNDLRGELTCSICQQQYLTGENPEFPIKMGNCGHHVGSVCIMKWLSPLSPEGHNSCWCRQSVFSKWDKRNYRPVISATNEAPIAASELDAVSQQPWSTARPEFNPARDSYDTGLRLHLWMQLLEAVVQNVEEANDNVANDLAVVASMMLGMETFPSHLEHWRLDRRQYDLDPMGMIQTAFPELCSQYLESLDEWGPMAGIEIDSRERVEGLRITEVAQGARAVFIANRARAAIWPRRLENRVARLRGSVPATLRRSDNELFLERSSFENIELATPASAATLAENDSAGDATVPMPRPLRIETYPSTDEAVEARLIELTNQIAVYLTEDELRAELAREVEIEEARQVSNPTEQDQMAEGRRAIASLVNIWERASRRWNDNDNA